MANDRPLSKLISDIPGPILVLGASGFVGASLLKMLAAHRTDIVGTTSKPNPWRLADTNNVRVVSIDLLGPQHAKPLFDSLQPRTVFDCVAYGAYSFETDVERIYQTTFLLKASLVHEILARGNIAYWHLGSSSEYGANCYRPAEGVQLTPNSDYAVAKAATSGLVFFAGKHRGVRCANLRLYSAYGPLEDRARLVPTLISHACAGSFPPFVNADTSRDFVFIEDVCQALVYVAALLEPDQYGESFNVGSGVETTIRDLAALAKELFGIASEPVFSTMESRQWDVTSWVADAAKIRRAVGWCAKTQLRDGLIQTRNWYLSLEARSLYDASSKLRPR